MQFKIFLATLWQDNSLKGFGTFYADFYALIIFLRSYLLNASVGDECRKKK